MAKNTGNESIPDWAVEGGHFVQLLQLSGGCNLETMLQKAYF